MTAAAGLMTVASVTMGTPDFSYSTGDAANPGSQRITGANGDSWGNPQ
jgi:hypothetical protein